MKFGTGGYNPQQFQMGGQSARGQWSRSRRPPPLAAMAGAQTAFIEGPIEIQYSIKKLRYGPQKCVQEWPIGLLLEVLGHSFTYFWGPGMAWQLGLRGLRDLCNNIGFKWRV